MKKVVLILLCLGTSCIYSMAGNKKLKRRYSVLYETPILGDTETLDNKLEDEGLLETKGDLAKRKKVLLRELSLASLLLQATKQLSLEAKSELEKRTSQLEWQSSLNDILSEEVERKEQKREMKINEALREATIGLQEIEENFESTSLEDEIRANLLKRPEVQERLNPLLEAIRQIRSRSDARLDSEPRLSFKPTVLRQLED